jgi:hypothetical protein
MKYLPNPIFLNIYKYVGHNALYLNKDYYNYLVAARKKFVDKPLTLEYRLARWRQKQYDIENNFSNKARPSIKVDGYKQVHISRGNFGSVADDGTLEYFTKSFESSIIPVSECKYVVYPTPCLIVYYWTIYNLRCVSKERYKKYIDLWIM